MADDSHYRQRLLFVTGMLGAGKTTALAALEDLGWGTMDNFPMHLLGRLLSEDENGRPATLSAPMAIGFDVRTMGFDPAEIVAQLDHVGSQGSYAIETLFLDCASRELERRYNETRRRHPLSEDMPATAGIAAEREMLEPLRDWAEAIVNTTDYRPGDLTADIRRRFALEAPAQMIVTISSFGFARGMPPVADLVFDMRFLDNPHWDPDLRALTGRDAAVAAHIRRDPGFAPARDRIVDLLAELLPRYDAQGKAYVNIAFGCTGGRHRSVFMAEEVGKALRAHGFSPTVLHRNLAARAGDLTEEPRVAPTSPD